MEMSSLQFFCGLKLNLEYGDSKRKKKSIKNPPKNKTQKKPKTQIKNNANNLLNFEGLEQLELLVF